MPETVRNGFNAGEWKVLPYEAFREGVTVHWIRRFEGEAPGVALLKYEAGASVPRHLHAGLETILVLEGSQSDETGRYQAGSYIVNAPGSRHSVWSDDGCVVLIQWDKPVQMLD